MSAFEWDPAKAAANLEKHGIAFEDAVAIFDGWFHRISSHRPDEQRFLAVGPLEDIMVSVVYTVRNDRIRIISVRRARLEERTAYAKACEQDRY